MNKICLITGATDGIGKQTALELARKGFILGLVGRNSEKGTQVVSEIISKTGNESIQFHQADLSSISEMRRLATEIQNTYESLDVLLNNAGAYFNNFSTTVDGLESTFALNHIAYFYLTELLLEIVKNETPGRIINVASAAHRNSKLDFDNIQGIDDYKGWPAYGRSKLMNIMFSYECHRRFSDSGVTFNCLHPGFVNSSFGNNNVGFARGSLNFAKSLFAIPVIKGALTSIYLASSEEVEGVSGEYFDKCKPIKSSKVSYSKNDQNQLWEISESFLESIQKY
ncbi:MAG: SDR family oxidoreductase [Candidatus Marinimicrobia bacterium]|jgi:NAD(P)-dependent dehydrogenase (short-subunit alcohol dehydrogenase family)|nr:SDR family oxidoreductase [Candidatus Neomarinimicrobiota bacterium]|tara:strand:+ start:8040 stop:8888 length:849 start_codon:yes stop_codon:yes gene_type:complete